MNINDLILNVKKKLESNIMIEDLLIEDKSFIHKNHKNNDQGKFHLKLTIKSKDSFTVNNPLILCLPGKSRPDKGSLDVPMLANACFEKFGIHRR